MFINIVAFLLGLTGTLWAFAERGSEISLWFLSMGVVLALTSALLALLGLDKLPRWRDVDRGGLVAFLLAQVALLLSMLFRARGRITLFLALLTVAMLAWGFALVRHCCFIITKWRYSDE